MEQENLPLAFPAGTSEKQDFSSRRKFSSHVKQQWLNCKRSDPDNE